MDEICGGWFAIDMFLRSGGSDHGGGNGGNKDKELIKRNIMALCSIIDCSPGGVRW